MNTTYTDTFIADTAVPNIASMTDDFGAVTNSSGLRKVVAIAAFAFCMGSATAGQANYVGAQVTGSPNTLILGASDRRKDDEESLLYAGFPWMTQELLDFMSEHQNLSAISIDWLRDTLRTVFGNNIQMDFRTHTDPEEGWTKVILNACTGVEDIMARIEKEDDFFAIVDRNPKLKSALGHTIISFS